jgi:hypothetical protein
MHQERQSNKVRERDRGLAQVRRLRRGAAVATGALVLGFGALAAHASPGRQQLHQASSAAPASGPSSSTASPSPWSSSSPVVAAPPSTAQAPTVTSGGS